MRASKVARAAIQRAHAELHLRAVRDHIGRLTGLDAADGDHRRLQRIDIARNDALQRDGDMRSHQHRIDRQLRNGTVAAAPCTRTLN